MTPALQLYNVAIHFGGVKAVDGVSMSVTSGDFVGLIGPNGAGKTTLIRIVAGVLRADRGTIALSGHRRLPRHHRLSRGERAWP